MKAMTIGISPNYNFPGSDAWLENDTYYASNHGGSFITRAIMKEFNADYIDNFDDIFFLQNKYDTCILALATHANNRDITKYVEIVEKLKMRVIIVSLGISDYNISIVDYPTLHPSILRLLSLASESSTLIGVRGPYTAHLLHRYGFKDVVPIGCPTVFWNMTPTISLNLKSQYAAPLVVYQENLAKDNFDLIRKYPLLGQDFKDEVIFTNNLDHDIKLVNFEQQFYNALQNKEDIYAHLRTNGIFPKNFDTWFNNISNADFVFGPRLHGIICAIVQGIPAVLTTRDLRTQEMASMFNIPNISHSDISNKTFQDIQDLADFDDFIHTYTQRYKNYLYFIDRNQLISNLEPIDDRLEFNYLFNEHQTFFYLNSLKT